MVFRSGSLSFDIQGFLDYEDGQEARRPHCTLCGEAIWEDTAVRIAGDWICDPCLSDHREPILD